MGTPSFAALGAGAIVFVGLVFTIIGPPRHVPLPPEATNSSPAPAPSAVSAGGVVLTSVNVALPDDSATFPDGPHADVINANCTACHSASMALNQPRMSADQWTGIVEKMRDTYKAPVAAGAVPDIVAYLVAMSDKLPAASGGAPASADHSGGTG